MAALVALLGSHGILPDDVATRPDGEAAALTTALSENIVRRLESPDSPPPRA